MTQSCNPEFIKLSNAKNGDIVWWPCFVFDNYTKMHQMLGDALDPAAKVQLAIDFVEQGNMSNETPVAYLVGNVPTAQTKGRSVYSPPSSVRRDYFTNMSKCIPKDKAKYPTWQKASSTETLALLKRFKKMMVNSDGKENRAPIFTGRTKKATAAKKPTTRVPEKPQVKNHTAKNTSKRATATTKTKTKVPAKKSKQHVKAWSKKTTFEPEIEAASSSEDEAPVNSSSKSRGRSHSIAGSKVLSVSPAKKSAKLKKIWYDSPSPGSLSSMEESFVSPPKDGGGSSIPKGEVMIRLLQDRKFKCTLGPRYYHSSNVDPNKKEEFKLGRDYFKNINGLRKYLCAYGLKSNDFRSDKEGNDLKNWIRYAIVPFLRKATSLPENFQPISSKEAWALMRKLGFKWTNVYCLPGVHSQRKKGQTFDETMLKKNIGVNAFEAMDGQYGMSAHLARFGLPMNCDFSNITEAECLQLEVYLTECKDVETFVTEPYKVKETDPPLVNNAAPRQYKSSEQTDAPIGTDRTTTTAEIIVSPDNGQLKEKAGGTKKSQDQDSVVPAADFNNNTNAPETKKERFRTSDGASVTATIVTRCTHDEKSEMQLSPAKSAAQSMPDDASKEQLAFPDDDDDENNNTNEEEEEESNEQDAPTPKKSGSANLHKDLDNNSNDDNMCTIVNKNNVTEINSDPLSYLMTQQFNDNQEMVDSEDESTASNNLVVGRTPMIRSQSPGDLQIKSVDLYDRDAWKGSNMLPPSQSEGSPSALSRDKLSLDLFLNGSPSSVSTALARLANSPSNSPKESRREHSIFEIDNSELDPSGLNHKMGRGEDSANNPLLSQKEEDAPLDCRENEIDGQYLTQANIQDEMTQSRDENTENEDEVQESIGQNVTGSTQEVGEEEESVNKSKLSQEEVVNYRENDVHMHCFTQIILQDELKRSGDEDVAQVDKTNRSWEQDGSKQDEDEDESQSHLPGFDIAPNQVLVTDTAASTLPESRDSDLKGLRRSPRKRSTSVEGTHGDTQNSKEHRRSSRHGRATSFEETKKQRLVGANNSNDSELKSIGQKSPTSKASLGVLEQPQQTKPSAVKQKKLTMPEKKRSVVKKLNSATTALSIAYDVEELAGISNDQTSLEVSPFAKRLKEIESFLCAVADSHGSHSMSGNAASLYVCGAPGTGKSSAVTWCCNQILQQAEQEVNSLPTFCHINAAHVQTASSNAMKVVMEKIGESLRMKNKNPSEAKIEQYLNLEGNSKKKTATVVVIDEIDLLLSDRKKDGIGGSGDKVLSLLLEWASRRDLSFGLIGISNAVGNHNARRLSSLGMISKTITFSAYRKEDLVNIVECRIGRTIVDPKAIEFAASKVSATSGDARKVLDLTSSAIAKCLEKMSDKQKSSNMDGPIVKMPHMMKAVRDTNPKHTQTIAGLPQMAKVILCVALSLSTVGPQWKTISLGKLKKFCSEAGLRQLFDDELNIEIFWTLVQQLSDAGLLLTGRTCPTEELSHYSFGELHRIPISLGVQLQDVESALQETLGEQKFYREMIEYVKTNDYSNYI